MATKTWNGSDGLFSLDGNWSSQVAPASGDTALITAGTVTATGTLPGSLVIALTSSNSSSPELILSDATLAASSQLNLTAGGTNATLRVRGAVNNQGTITATGTSPGAAFLRIDDTLAGGATRLLNTGSILVSGTAFQVVTFGTNADNQLQNDGLISIFSPDQTPQLAYVGVNLTGTGTVLLGVGVTFKAARAVSASQTFVFDRGVSGATTLRMDAGTQFNATIDGFASSDTIQLFSPRWDTASYASTGASSGVLTLSLNGVVSKTMAFQGSYTRDSFILQQSSPTGSSQSNTIITTTMAEVAAAPKPVNGSPGNDTFADNPGSQLFAGGEGYDVLTLDEGRRGATFSLLSNGDVSFSHRGQVDIIRGIEEIRFLDGREVFDPADPAAAITRMYQAGLGRVPEQGGLNFWIAGLQHGAPLADLAVGFFSSPEFTARFGTGLSNNDFVTRIYQNVLGRDPEAGGLAFWRDNLDGNRMTRGQTLAGISESAENRAGTTAQVASGIWDVSETSMQVARLYDTALGRLPDAGGLGFWTRAIDNGGRLVDLANSFVSSAEFQSTYGTLDNRGFVDAVYANTLDRPGDAGGVDFWTDVLNKGTPRAQVVIGFSESVEHQRNTETNIMDNDPNNYGIKLA